MKAGSLAGIRVLDLGIITAGAATSALLADLGADVIKIEAASYADPFRQWRGSDAVSPHFRATNRNKRGLELDLKTARGRELFLALAAGADVVVENFRRGVLPGLGLGLETLRQANPGIVLASISSQGAEYVSFGTTLEAMSGMAALGGYPGGPPAPSGREMNYPDQVVALFAAGMIVTALYARARTGEGAHLDISQRELTSFLCGDAFVAGLGRDRLGGADDGMHLIQDAFPSTDGRWLAVSVARGQEEVIRTLTGGAEAGDLGGWIAARPAEQAERALRAAGVACAVVLGGEEAGAAAEAAGSMAIHRIAEGFPVKGFPFALAEAPLFIVGDAPDIGVDSAEILGELGTLRKPAAAGADI